jgi:hypothetical protein
LAVSLWLGIAAHAHAWIYPEHRDQAAAAIERLGAEHRARLDALWEEARKGYEARLCSSPAAGDQGEKPTCIDLAAWPAIAGDHSCSADDMLTTVLDSDWILKVAGLSARAKEEIARAMTVTPASKAEAQIRNALTRLDLGLERADKQYSSRASAGNAHFLVPRQSFEVGDYIALTLRPGAETNAMALYLVHHSAALKAAAQLDSAPPAERAARARLILALETFALHFLEDSFAAGHIAGSWGKVAQRKGTHDYYNIHGLESRTWNDDPMILFGDARMRPADLERVSKVIAASLAQVLDAMRPGSEAAVAAGPVMLAEDLAAGKFDACNSPTVPDFAVPPESRPLMAGILRDTPIPYRGPGEASLPRFHAELGPFAGLAAGGGGAWYEERIDGGRGVSGSLNLGLRLGVGLENLLADSGDGQLFLEGFITMTTRESSNCGADCTLEQQIDALLPSFPARSALGLKFRAPFWLIPGDLILATPILAFTSPETLKKMGIAAANGGLIPWQAGIATSVGRFQFVLGREVSATFFGYWNGDDTMIIETGTDPSTGRPTFDAIGVRSIRWDFPILEYRPYRSYGAQSTQTVLLQLGAGAEHPERVRLLLRQGQPPELDTRYFAFLRISVDTRRYF